MIFAGVSLFLTPSTAVLPIGNLSPLISRFHSDTNQMLVSQIYGGTLQPGGRGERVPTTLLRSVRRWIWMKQVPRRRDTLSNFHFSIQPFAETSENLSPTPFFTA